MRSLPAVVLLASTCVGFAPSSFPRRPRAIAMRATPDAPVVEYADADAVFAVIDADGSGTISKDELESHLTASGLEPPAVVRMFESLDVDSDGCITRDELRAGFERYAFPKSPRLESAHARADEIYAVIDTNGDDAITMEELAFYLGSAGYNPETVVGIFHRIDANNDAAISRDELRAGFARYGPLIFASDPPGIPPAA